jgi:hypothetical protein
MRKALIIVGWCIAILVTLVTAFLMLAWSRGHLDWFVPVNEARLQVDGLSDQPVSLFKRTSAFFTPLPDRTMVLIENGSGKKQTYVILGPGPGHLPEGFRGSIQRCESVFVATPLFGFADDYSQCSTPAPNRDGNRDAKFDARFVEFTADDGKRLRVEW